MIIDVQRSNKVRLKVYFDKFDLVYYPLLPLFPSFCFLPPIIVMFGRTYGRTVSFFYRQTTI